MQALSSTAIKFLRDDRLSLFGIAVSLSLFNLFLAWRVTDNANQLIVNGLMWVGILLLIWNIRDNLATKSGIVASFLGIFILVVILLKSLSLFWFESVYLKILPLVSWLGLGLLASGFRGIKQYWRELIIISLLCIPDPQLVDIIENRFQITVLTAKFSTFILWYVGFEVQRQGVNLALPTGSVAVNVLCTGIGSAILLFKLAVPFVFLYLNSWQRKLGILFGAVFVAFALSVVRVAFLAVIVSDREAFKYWHGGAGNEIFSTIAIVVFGALCNFAIPTDEPLENEAVLVSSAALDNDADDNDADDNDTDESEEES